MADRTIAQKFADWKQVYDSIRGELSPEALRALTVLAAEENVQTINVGLAAARVVYANDRAAAMVAALITANGIKPVAFDFGDDPT